MTAKRDSPTLARSPEPPTLVRPPERPERPERHGSAPRRRPSPHPAEAKPRFRRRSGADNLPQTVDSFLGRDEDLRRIGELLERGRMVTITGAPGMGKTRLAVEVARSLAPTFPAGTWLVQLAPVAKGDLVSPAVAAAFGVAEHAGSDVTDDLVGHIGDRRLLIVLDNCEHVLASCAHLVSTLLEACPELHVLATSQERLAVGGEQIWILSGLPHDGTTAAETLPPAVQLFAERGRAAVPDFEVTPDTLPAVVDVCRRLDGIPLAIELAAARLRTFSPAEIAHLLNDRFALLTGGRRSALPRHQTLRAAVDWSYELLDDPEQRLLRRLSVFAGGATVDAIEQVCSGDGVDRANCVDLLTTLVERSLVVPHRADTGDGTRYDLLETIRYYGRECMAEAGETATTASRHVQWCMELAAQAEPQLTGPDQAVALERLEADHDNLRAALSFGFDRAPADQAMAVALAGSLSMFWRLHGNFREGLHWLDRAAAVGDAAPKPDLAKALWGQALMLMMFGLFDSAAEPARRCARLYQELEDPPRHARALLLVGYVQTGDGENQQALQRAIALARQFGDSWCLAQALGACGAELGRSGDNVAAQPMLEESVMVARSTGDRLCLIESLVLLGQSALAQSDLDIASAALDEALALGSGAGPYEVATTLTLRAAVARERGDFELARRLLTESESVATDSGHRFVDLRNAQARLALAEGEVQRSGQLFGMALGHAQALGATSIASWQGMGEAALAHGDPGSARPHFLQALGHARSENLRDAEADAVHWLGHIDRLEGRTTSAASSYQEALQLRRVTGNAAGLAASLDALAGVMVAEGKAAQAARLFGAAQAERARRGILPSRQASAIHDADVEAARQNLGPEGFDDAWAAGMSMSLNAAVKLAERRRRTRKVRPVRGLEALTDAEREVARLALAGLTNREMCSRLFVSTSTVKTHLARVYAKLEVSSRAQLRERYSDSSL